MAICIHCKVDIGQAKRCPLCGTAAGGENPDKPTMAGLYDRAASAKPDARAKRMVGLETISVSLAIAALSVAVIDLLGDFRMNWAWYPLASIALAWLLVGPVVLLPKKPAIFLPVQILSVFGFLLALDAIDGQLNWSWQLGLPIAAAAFAMIAMAVFMSMKAKRRGVNVFAFALLAVAGFCIALEGFAAMYKGGVFRLAWSSITASAIIPVAAFLLYAHYRLTKNATLKKLFHL